MIHSGTPQQVDTFVHRSGRTARAGRSGVNVVMFTPRDRGHHDDLKQLQKVGWESSVNRVCWDALLCEHPVYHVQVLHISAVWCFLFTTIVMRAPGW